MNPKRFNSAGEKGTTAVLLLSLLFPILVGVSYSILRLSQLRDLRWLRENCRGKLIPAQRMAGQNIQTLLGLNAMVRALKSEKTIAEVTLRLATAHGDAPGIAEAKRWLADIRRRQQGVKTQQQTLIRTSEAELASAKYGIISNNQNWAVAQRALYTVDITGPTPARPRLGVRTTSHDQFPEYELVPQFKDRQAVEFKWLVQFQGKQTGVKKWIKFNYTIPEACGVTLVEAGAGFEIKLHQDRFFWNR